jgi:hypothetical protein
MNQLYKTYDRIADETGFDLTTKQSITQQNGQRICNH